MDLARHEPAVGALHRRGADVVAGLDVLEADRFGDRHGRVVGKRQPEILSVARLHRQDARLDGGDHAADAGGRLRVGRGARERKNGNGQREPHSFHGRLPLV